MFRKFERTQDQFWVQFINKLDLKSGKGDMLKVKIRLGYII